MNSNVRRSGRVAVVLVLCLVVSAWLGAGLATNVGRGFSPANAGQAVPAPDLDRALRAGDLAKARQLMPVSWAASEQLFVSYLQRAFITPDAVSTQPDARTLAARWAEVHFVIVEYDFARAVLLALDTPDAARRQPLIAATRDYYDALDHLRNAYRASGAAGPSTTEAARLRAEFTAVADRFRALPFPRGELSALRSMVNLWWPQSGQMADKLAEQLGDDLSLVRKRPYTDAGLALAERLGLPNLQVFMLESLADPLARATDPARLEQAVKYLERARAVARTIPVLETVNYPHFISRAPKVAQSVLPNLWNVYQKLGRPADTRPLLPEAIEISRSFGEGAVTATIQAFANRTSAAGWEAAADILAAARPFGAQVEIAAIAAMAPSAGRSDWASRLLEASRSFGPKVVVETLAALGPAATSRSDLFADALAQAVAQAVTGTDLHERAATLEWLNRRLWAYLGQFRGADPGRTAGDLGRFFTPTYLQLRDLCVASAEHGLTADALAIEGEIHARFGDPALAAGVYRQAIALAEEAGDPQRVARIANRAADFFKGRPSDASRVELAAKAADAARRAGDAYELTKALQAKGESVEDRREALAAATRHTEQSGNPDEELKCMDYLAQAYLVSGDYRAAVDGELRLVDRVNQLKASGSNLGAGWELTAYTRIVDFNTIAGEPTQARAAAAKVRDLVESSIAPTDKGPGSAGAPALAEAYRNLGDLAARLGEPVDAIGNWETAFKKAADLRARNPNLADSLQRRILEARGTLYTQLGDYEAALKDWNGALPLARATLRNSNSSEASQMATWMTAVGWTHALAGNLDKALESARNAMAELKRDPSGQWGQRVFDGQSANDRILAILLTAGHPEEAIAFFEELRRSPTITPEAERWLLGLLARASARAGDPGQARSLLLKAIDLDRDAGERTDLAADLLALGALELDLGSVAEAEARFRQARGAVNPYDEDRIWQVERTLGVALARSGDTAQAAAHYEKALAALESLRERRRPDELRLVYGFDRSLVYEEYAALLAAQAASSRQPADAERAFDAAERKLAQTLRELLSVGWSRVPAKAMPEQLRRSLEMEARLSAKQAILRQQLDKPQDQRDTPLVERLERERVQIQTDHARLLTSISQGQYRFAAPANAAASLAGPVRSALGPTRVLVEYLVTNARTYAFVVSSSAASVVPLAVGRESLREQVQQLLAPFRQLRTGRVDLTRLDFDTRAAHTLYQAIFAPVRPLIGSASNVIIVPDDVLNLLPFDALVPTPPKTAARSRVVHAEFADQAFLLQRYAISYLSSAADLIPSAGAGGSPPAPKWLFAVANPTAGSVQPEAAHDDPLKRQLRSAGSDAYSAPLPGADAEVRRIARYFPAGSSTVVSGGSATEAAYRSQAGDARIVHFATHAVTSDRQPFYSTMVLAPDAKAGDDGFLQAYEVLRTPLRAELVVLSACETALGSEDWGQGLVGLATAFDQAGARSVLATLWSIDESTADVMAAFYRGMAQGSAAPAALRQAKLQLLQRRIPLGNVEVSLAHPFFWAPFKLVGR
jgi:CHAT domain-containing protein